MDLVHDIDPLTDRRRGIDRLIPQGPDLVYAVVGGGIQLQHIQDRAVFNAQAGRALIAGLPFTGLWQFTARDRILAQVVLPVPRVPVNR